ncbi:type III secretion system inner rod subunit SctI [Paludibacterium paludis]|uniref:Protein MxiI n=1 Tax=Paludibacterium paludis TaxID=1225769 RepID=A0A918P5Z9_9NEIS|nr:type III secretion system inner rod subunit SctI [Paludibacterium paludis]GGY23888.1 protein MxiI [Paludibacterium paludis]
MSVAPIQPLSSLAEKVTLNEDATVMPLEDRVMQAMADTTVEGTKLRGDILKSISEPGALSSPDKLMKLQVMTSNYSLEVSYISTMARKATNVVETLLKS